MNQFLSWCLAHWSFVAFVLAIFIQITPAIKWNPFTALCKWIGSVITAETRHDITDLKTLVQEIRREIDEIEKDRIRWEVLDFANACRNGVRHTKDEFHHIIALDGKYKKLLEKTHDVNGVFDAEYAYILDLYRERQEKNDFL